jgi:hypothetical protein
MTYPACPATGSTMKEAAADDRSNADAYCMQTPVNSGQAFGRQPTVRGSGASFLLVFGHQIHIFRGRPQFCPFRPPNGHMAGILRLALGQYSWCLCQPSEARTTFNEKSFQALALALAGFVSGYAALSIAHSEMWRGHQCAALHRRTCARPGLRR